MKNKLLFLLSILLCAGISAQNLSGNWGYKIDCKYVKLYGDKIQNQNNGGTSGTLKVALWATKYPYNGGTISGYKLYEYALDPLEAGHYYYDVSKTGWCTYPPNGSYYLTILLLEYNYDYEIVDYISMDGYIRF